jgi:Ni2+-binding GTPase involved in maturation of urease and hydrogenase
MIETAGRVTKVCKFSRLEDQMTILVFSSCHGDRALIVESLPFLRT